MNNEPARHRPGREPRLSPIVTVLPYGLLGMLALFTTVIKRAERGSLAIDLALCAVAAAWMLGMFTLRPMWWNRPGRMAVFLAGLVVIMAVLVLRDSWFGFLAVAGYAYAFSLLPWPGQLFGVAAVAIVAGTAQTNGLPEATPFAVTAYVTVLAVNVLATGAGAWAFWNSDEQHHQAREANRRLEATLAENAGLQQKLIEQAREAGMQDERQRMAREIHDTLAQGLTGIITQLHAAEQAEQSGDDPEAWRRRVEAAIRLAKESLTEARRSVHALRPEPLEDARLSEALADVAARWEGLHGVKVQMATTGTVRPMPPDAEVALLRTAQESLANVAKHAQASRVGLTLSYLDHEIALDVRDDGRGFDPARPATPSDSGGGFGLVAMRQRIESLAGTLQIESEDGAGTAVSARIPLTSEGA